MPGEGGKTDMERIGLFSEMEYVTVGDKYVSQFNRKYIWFSLLLKSGYFLYEHVFSIC